MNISVIVAINLIVQFLSYLFIALLLFVSYLKFKKGTKAEDISIKGLVISTLYAFITSAFMIYFAGWVWDTLGIISIVLGVVIGSILALISKVFLSNENIVLVQGRKIGTLVWLISVIIGEFILMWFNDNTALQASFLFGFFVVASMNTIYFVKFIKLKLL